MNRFCKPLLAVALVVPFALGAASPAGAATTSTPAAPGPSGGGLDLGSLLGPGGGGLDLGNLLGGGGNANPNNGSSTGLNGGLIAICAHDCDGLKGTLITVCGWQCAPVPAPAAVAREN